MPAIKQFARVGVLLAVAVTLGCRPPRAFLAAAPDPPSTMMLPFVTEPVAPTRPEHGNGPHELLPPVHVDGRRASAGVRLAEPVAGEPAHARPRVVQDFEHISYHDLTLPEAVRIALDNCELIRVNDGFLAPNNPLFTRPELVPSVYDPAIASSEVLVGQRGPQSALADFDPQLNTRILWGGDERIQNSRLLSGGIPPGEALMEGTAVYQSELARNLASGGRLGLVHDWNYNRSNRTSQLFSSAYDGALRAQFRQPLLAGAGREYTSIAGNISDASLNVTGIPQGVQIAAVNQNVSVLELEQNIARLVREVEAQYWQLELMYATFEIVSSRRQEVHEALDLVRSRADANAVGGGAAEVAQLRDLALQSDVERQNAFDAVLQSEARLRRLLGIPAEYESVLRPLDKPSEAELIVDWDASVSLAIVARSEIRRQEELVRGLRLQLRAAQHLLKPRLDLVAEYRLNGFGDNLLGQGNPYSSAYGTLFSGEQTGWNAGFQYSSTLGNRVNRERVRNAELKLTRALSVLREQHVEVGHELAFAFRELHRAWLESEVQRERVEAARQRVEALQSQFRIRGETAELVNILNAQEVVAQARMGYAASLAKYTDAIAEWQFRQGRLLSTHGVFLEGGWNVDATDITPD